MSSTLSGINPYARYRLDERTSFWGTLGYGSGRLALTPDGAESALETDMTNAMAAFGGRGVLSMRAGETGQFELALRTDAMLTDTASMAVAGLSGGEGGTSRIRLILEGSGSLPAFGGVLAPKVEAGLRYDGGDAETGAGLEVGGGLAYDMARLTVQVDGRVLLTHRDRDYEEWGYSLSFVYQPASDGRGLRYRAGSQWGAAQSGVQSLWSLQNAGGLASGARTRDCGARRCRCLSRWAKPWWRICATTGRPVLPDGCSYAKAPPIVACVLRRPSAISYGEPWVGPGLTRTAREPICCAIRWPPGGFATAPRSKTSGRSCVTGIRRAPRFTPNSILKPYASWRQPGPEVRHEQSAPSSR